MPCKPRGQRRHVADPQRTIGNATHDAAVVVPDELPALNGVTEGSPTPRLCACRHVSAKQPRNSFDARGRPDWLFSGVRCRDGGIFGNVETRLAANAAASRMMASAVDNFGNLIRSGRVAVPPTGLLLVNQMFRTRLNDRSAQIAVARCGAEKMGHHPDPAGAAWKPLLRSVGPATSAAGWLDRPLGVYGGGGARFRRRHWLRLGPHPRLCTVRPLWTSGPVWFEKLQFALRRLLPVRGSSGSVAPIVLPSSICARAVLLLPAARPR